MNLLSIKQAIAAGASDRASAIHLQMYVKPMCTALEAGEVSVAELQKWCTENNWRLEKIRLVDEFEQVLKELRKHEAGVKSQKKNHDYTITLSGRKLWVAEISGEGGTYGLERRFMDKDERKYVSAYGARTEEIQFLCKNGIIYEDSNRVFWFNGEKFDTYEDAKIAQLQAKKKVAEIEIPEQAEINRRAWAIAKRLAGGSKGSRKYIAQAFKQVWAQIKATNVVEFPSKQQIKKAA